MNKSTVISLQDRDRITDPMTDLLRTGACKLLEQAIQAELEELLSDYTGQQTDTGHAAVVRNGYLPERAIQTGIGPVTAKYPKSVRALERRSSFVLHWFHRMFVRSGHWKPRFPGCISKA